MTMSDEMTLSQDLSSLPAMSATAAAFAILWCAALEISKRRIRDALPRTGWWARAAAPQRSMMTNFGYPSGPTERFPRGITDAMTRDSYAFVVAICAAHFASALPMLPVVLRGWEGASDGARSLFLLGTLSDVGFDAYDSVQTSVRAFRPGHPDPYPIEYWIVIVALHHVMAMTLVLPMNLRYVHRREYHQTAFSLLMAAALCYGAGCWKFSLDIAARRGQFLLYKAIVLSQLAIILYTRVYLWFPAVASLRAHLVEEGDAAFLHGASVMITLFSVFNLILVVDGLKAAANALPRKFPRTRVEREDTERELRRASTIDAPGLAELARVMELTHFAARRKFKGAVHAVVIANRLDASGGHDEKSD